MFRLGDQFAFGADDASGGRHEPIAHAVSDLAELAMGEAGFVEIAQHAADRMTGLIPRCCAFALECREDRRDARVVAGANMPLSWSGATFPLGESTLIAKALREPDATHKVLGAAVRASLPDQALPPTPPEAMVCAAVAAPSGASGVFAACCAQADLGQVSTVLWMLARLTSALARRRAPTSADEAVRAAIQRAKLEWECTVDSLPQVVCVLDRARRIVRVSRAVERWEIGRVRDLRLRTIHEVLHGKCARPDCALSVALEQAWTGLDGRAPNAVEVDDPVLGRCLDIVLRPMLLASDDGVSPNEPCATMVVSDVTETRRAQHDLRILNEQLEARVQSRTLALADVNQALRAQVSRCESTERLLEESRDELALLSAQLMRVQEDERRRIAQELHDSVGQELSAIKYSLERAAELGLPRPDDEQQGLLTKAITGIRAVMDDIRSISMNLRPALLDDLGVVSALQWFSRQFSERYPHLDLQVQLHVTDGEVPKALTVPIYRTVQEALCNVVKHAAADHARVSLHQAGGSLVLEVADDGIGFQPAVRGSSPESRLGLRGMRERAEMTGGRFWVDSRPDEGSVIRISWPLGTAPKQEPHA